MSYSLDKVVKNGYCIGCGGCNSLKSGRPLEMKNGLYIPELSLLEKESLHLADKICPFTDNSDNEDKISHSVFDAKSLKKDEYLGYWHSAYAGYSTEMRKYGASGGIITWILSKMLNDNLVDYIITVGEVSENHPRFGYKIVGDPAELKNMGGSAYYPVSFDQVINEVRNREGRFAFVGIPCFNKSLRLLRKEDPILDSKILYQVGLVCGHLKTKEYSDFLIRLAGMKEDQVKSIHFRRKSEEGKANEYLFEAVSGSGEVRTVSNKQIGANWGMGAFKPKACDYCDDVFAETADIVCMDAWLPQYIKDGKGISLFLTRSEELDAIVKKSIETAELVADEVSETELIDSQAGGIRHRRRGLKFRLAIAGIFGWVPQKRVKPTFKIGFWFSLVQLFRVFLRGYSKWLFSIQKRLSGSSFYTAMMYLPKLAFKVVSKLYRKFDRNPNLG